MPNGDDGDGPGFIAPTVRETPSLALLLLESLIYELVASNVLTSDRAIAVVEMASDARAEIALAEGVQVGLMTAQLDVIAQMIRMNGRGASD